MQGHYNFIIPKVSFFVQQNYNQGFKRISKVWFNLIPLYNFICPHFSIASILQAQNMLHKVNIFNSFYADLSFLSIINLL